MEQQQQQPQQQQQQLRVELGEKESEGIYSNIVFIHHSFAEFILDFGRMLPGVQKHKVFARVIMTPQHAALLHRALEENLKKFEEKFGPIKIPGKDEAKNIGFRS